MLRRHSTKSKGDLQRRKSTTSVRSVTLEHINAVTADRDAKIAALQAFSRGQDRHFAKTNSMFPAKKTAHHHNEESSPTAQLRHSDSAASEREGSGLGRRQSVRFVGNGSALATRASRITMRTAAPEREDSATIRRSIQRSQSSQDFIAGQPLALRDAQTIQLPDRLSSRGKTMVTPKPALKQDYLTDLLPVHQKYTPEDDVASMPSSFRRLRKSRSMFSTRNSLRNGQGVPVLTSAPVPVVAPITSRPRFSFWGRKENEPTAPSPSLKSPKSLSFLHHRQDHVNTSKADHEPDHEKSPIMSGSSEEHSLRSRILPKPSTFLGGKGGRLGLDTRKTLRGSTSNTALPVSETTNSISLSIHGSMRIKARKVSSTIKSRIKNLFVNKSEEHAKFPAQQIESQRSHVANLFDVDHLGPAASDIGCFHVHENSALARVSSRLPVLHAVPSSERLRSRSGSINSCKSEGKRDSDEKSRVTSWASTEANTIVAHGIHEDSEVRDRQRLSVITENGVHATSPSLLRPKPGLQTITSQEVLAPQSISDRLAPGAAVDSQRVYSALMKRMSNTQKLFDKVRNCSDDSDPFRTLSPPTSDDSSDNGEALAVSTVHPQVTGNHDVHPVLREYLPERNPARLRPSLDVAKPDSDRDLGQYRSLSPPVQLTPKGVDRPLVDRSSAFFGSPTSHLFRTRSPWRKSLQEAIDASRVLSQEPVVDQRQPGSDTDVADRKADSASTYSQDTQIRKVEMKEEYPVVSLSKYLKNQGYSTVDGDAINSYYPTGQRQASAASSVDWKAHLAHDVARTGCSPTSPTRVSGRPCEIDYVVPTMPRAFGQGHVREAAQIGTCEEDEYNASPAVRMPTNPTTPLGVIEPNVQLTPQQRSVLKTTPPSASALNESAQAPSRTSVSLGEDGMTYMIPKDALRPRASPLRSCGGSGTNSFQTPSQDSALPLRQAKSLAQIQVVAQVRAEETGSPRRGTPTVRLMRRSTAKVESAASPAMSTSGFSTAFTRQFGSLSKKLGEAKENQDPTRLEEDSRLAGNGDSHHPTHLRGSPAPARHYMMTI
ncbi:hypothetical protein N0V93_009270 [Gnomoniopsis smithogilvyi]|uniref:Uncharacterized protein n=1 Tax=Gnomoniopsis smithogilvyi TaxID=1191159 RepID=A0A9W8YMG5_9PEZI|nr:hypothetical protein N0V93_009270 [Gnomoniopsis smithogilvyi]